MGLGVYPEFAVEVVTERTVDCEVFRDSSFDMFVEATVDSEVPAEVAAERFVDTFPEATAEEKDVAAEATPEALFETFVEKLCEMYERVWTLKPCSSDGEGMTD